MDNVLACIISEGSIAGNVRLDFSAIQIANSVNAIRRVPLHKPANKKPETAPAKIILEVNTATSAKPVTTTTPAVLVSEHIYHNCLVPITHLSRLQLRHQGHQGRHL
jgi:hypothetical protein